MTGHHKEFTETNIKRSAPMNFDLLITIGLVLGAGLYLFWKFRKKDAGCCGCTGCSGELKSLNSCNCPTQKK